MSKREFIAASAALTGSLLMSKTAVASTKYEVLMLNKDPDNSKNKMIFSPRLLKVQVGDEVSFVPTDKGHNSEIIKGMLPAGAEKWKGKINKQVDVVFRYARFLRIPMQTARQYGYDRPDRRRR
jgi:plastocyanin